MTETLGPRVRVRGPQDATTGGCTSPVQPTVLPAYVAGGAIYVWCDHERRWHYHSEHDGATEGHRASHCACPRSPYWTSGYRFRVHGRFTAEVRRRYGRQRRVCGTCRAAGRW